MDLFFDRQCPFCYKGGIHVKATKCPHCGSDLPYERPRRRPQLQPVELPQNYECTKWGLWIGVGMGVLILMVGSINLGQAVFGLIFSAVMCAAIGWVMDKFC